MKVGFQGRGMTVRNKKRFHRWRGTKGRGIVKRICVTEENLSKLHVPCDSFFSICWYFPSTRLLILSLGLFMPPYRWGLSGCVSKVPLDRWYCFTFYTDSKRGPYNNGPGVEKASSVHLVPQRRRGKKSEKPQTRYGRILWAFSLHSLGLILWIHQWDFLCDVANRSGVSRMCVPGALCHPHRHHLVLRRSWGLLWHHVPRLHSLHSHVPGRLQDSCQVVRMP